MKPRRPELAATLAERLYLTHTPVGLAWAKLHDPDRARWEAVAARIPEFANGLPAVEARGKLVERRTVEGWRLAARSEIAPGEVFRCWLAGGVIYTARMLKPATRRGEMSVVEPLYGVV